MRSHFPAGIRRDTDVWQRASAVAAQQKMLLQQVKHKHARDASFTPPSHLVLRR